MQNDLQFPNVWLTDLETVKRHQMTAKDSTSWTEATENLLADFIEQASADIRAELGWLTLPYVDTLLFDWSSEFVSRDGRQLWLFDAALLLEITALTNGDTSTLATSQYTLYPNNSYPKTRINLLSGTCATWKPKTGGQWEQAISIAGIWGYVPHYATCWKLTGQTVKDDPLSSSATTLTVTSNTGFSRGWYLKIENEVLFVSAVDSGGTQLTVERGQLGTTAVAHDSDMIVRRFVHNNVIYRAATEWAAFLFKNKDHIGEQTQFYENGLAISQGLSPQLFRSLSKHSRVSAVSAN